jgi:hypothetical protein
MKATQRVPALQSGQLDDLPASEVLAIVFSCSGVSPRRKITPNRTGNPENVSLTCAQPTVIRVAPASHYPPYFPGVGPGRARANGRYRELEWPRKALAILRPQ